MQKLSEIHEINTMKLCNASFVGMILNEILPNVQNKIMLDKITNIPEAKQMFKMLRQIDIMNEKKSNEERAMARSQLNGWDIIMKRKNSKYKYKERGKKSFKDNSNENNTLVETESNINFNINNDMNANETEENKLLLPFYYDKLVETLLKIMKTKNRDSDFFYFSGLNSGIYVPEINEWPLSEGYTIMTWIKVESFDIEEISSGVTNTKYMNVTKKGKLMIKNNKVTNLHDYDYHNQYLPRIFSFVNKKNSKDCSAIELFFIENVIYISVTRDRKEETYSISNGYKFMPNEWYHIAIVHDSPKLWGNRSDLSLYINGRLNKVTKVKYPKTCNYEQSYIGCKGRSGTFSEISIQDVYQSFCGQMVSFNIFNCLFNEYNVASIYNLGMDQESEMDSIVYSESFISKYSKVLDEDIFSTSFICYHPKASETNITGDDADYQTELKPDYLNEDEPNKSSILNILFNKNYGEEYYDNLTITRMDSYKLYYYLFKIFNANSVDIINNLQINDNSIDVSHAYLFSVSRTSTKCIRNTLHSLGGINVLLPLILHTNLNRINFIDRPVVPVNNKDAVNELNQLNIINLNDTNTNSNNNASTNQGKERLLIFIRIISFLVLSDSFHQNTVKTSYFMAIINYLLYNYVSYSNLTIELYEEIEYFAEHINDEDMIYDILYNLLFNAKLWAMASIDVQIYYYTALQKFIDNHYSFCKENFGVSYFLKVMEKYYYYIPIKENKSINNVSDENDLEIIRKLIFKIIVFFLKNDSTPEELECILNSIVLNVDYKHSIELLQILKSLIINENDKNIIVNIVKYKHQNFFIKLIRNEDSECRIDALKIINYLLRSNYANERWKEKLRTNAKILIHSLEEYPLTNDVCLQLFEMCLETDLSTESEGDFLQMTLRNLRNTNIKNIKVLEFLIYLISKQNSKYAYGKSILPDDLKFELTFHDEFDDDYLSIVNEPEKIDENENENENEGKEEETIDEQTVRPLENKIIDNNEINNNTISTDNIQTNANNDSSNNINYNASNSLKKETNQSLINEFEVLKVKFLEDLFFLFNINENNCIAFMKNTEWPKLLISLIPESSFHKFKLNKESSDKILKEDTNSNIVSNMIIEIFYLLLDSSFETSKAWQELYSITYFYFLDNIDNSFVGVKEILKRYLQKINGGVLMTKVYSYIKLDNIIHLISFTEDWLFDHVDFEEIYHKLKNTEPNVSKSFFDITLFENKVLKKIPSTMSKNIVINESYNVSFPWEESRECCEILINSLISIINGKKTIPANILSKVMTKNDSLVRILFRFLNTGLSVYNKSIWEFIIEIYKKILDENIADLKTDSSLWGSTLGHIMGAIDMCNEDIIKNKDDKKLFYNELSDINYRFTNLWWPLIIQLKPGISDSFTNKTSISKEEYDVLVIKKVIDKYNDIIYQPALKAFEDSCFSLVLESCKNFEKIIGQVILNIRKKIDETEKKEYLKIKKEDETMAEIKNDQLEKIIKSRAKEDNKIRLIEKSWNTLIHEMSRDRGLWFFETNSTLTWKLDYTENSYRVRRRLIPNYEFEDHLDASFKRDRVKNDSGDAFLKIPRTTEKKKSKFEKLREKYGNSDYGSIGGIDSNVNSSNPSSIKLDDDITESDKWSIISDDDDLTSGFFYNKEDEKIIYKADCDLVMLTTTISGYLLLTSKNLYFYLNPLAVVTNITNSGQEGTISSAIIENELLRDRQWKLDEIVDIYIRRYLLRRSAIEIFFTDHNSIFFNFHISKESFKFFQKLVNLHPINLKCKESASPNEIFKKYHNITEMWQNRKLSNFDYLMFLNTISGRTFNDLTQYPVFPWVIKDYISETIDLNDPNIYRDLSKPIGALNEVRLEQFKERYYSFEDMEMDDIKPFFYGTHYSSAANVLFYMIRMEPFTTLHIALQSGKFDHPDRQFFSMENCWDSVINNTGDVKELIPEFYSTPEFLVNMNHFDLGKCNAINKVIDDVILPPWAKTPEEFIRIQRKALESEYVSNNLHNWIDLIWGYKQRGEEAVKAYNVFYYLTYEGAINLDNIKDPIQKKSIEDQINNFGQTPSQLLTKPHPKRNRLNIENTLINDYSNIKRIKQGGSFKENTPILRLFIYKDTYSDVERLIYVEKYGLYTLIDQPISSYPPRNSLFIRNILSSNSGRVCSNFQCFETLPNYLSVISCGYWDNSFVINTFDETEYSPLYGHFDIVTAVAVSKNVDFIVTGSKDTTVISWEIDRSNSSNTIIKSESKKIYYGHDDEITALAVDSNNDIIVSGSLDGTCIIYTLRDAKFLHSFKPFGEVQNCLISIKFILITNNADIIIFAVNHTKKQYLLQLYSLNGKLLMESYRENEIKSLIISNDQEHIIISDTSGVYLLYLYSFEILHQYSVDKDVISLALTSNEKKLIMGHYSGEINWIEMK
ncbi:beach-domain-containing protein [Neocallimastix californiae]|uniref:Beige protein homolog 1 n=1 Tax=Neocallimastix californiae TaxID=1754190 RepID=A0A1Y2ECE7_9FUNG|nr:beach-domain-containing protein [Neocallimastix californiae]|eukprot:ORY69241.1 beach-domain-containing protein [Neocallimastix californiae]